MPPRGVALRRWRDALPGLIRIVDAVEAPARPCLRFRGAAGLGGLGRGRRVATAGARRPAGDWLAGEAAGDARPAGDRRRRVSQARERSGSRARRVPERRRSRGPRPRRRTPTRSRARTRGPSRRRAGAGRDVHVHEHRAPEPRARRLLGPDRIGTVLPVPVRWSAVCGGYVQYPRPSLHGHRCSPPRSRSGSWAHAGQRDRHGDLGLQDVGDATQTLGRALQTRNNFAPVRSAQSPVPAAFCRTCCTAVVKPGAHGPWPTRT